VEKVASQPKQQGEVFTTECAENGEGEISWILLGDLGVLGGEKVPVPAGAPDL
jgi:hypothetical protein